MCRHVPVSESNLATFTVTEKESQNKQVVQIRFFFFFLDKYAFSFIAVLEDQQ